MKFVDWFCQNMRTGFLLLGTKANSKTTTTLRNVTTWCWMLKYVAEESSTLTLRQGVFMEQNVRLSGLSRAQEGQQWNSLEGRGWYHSQLLVTPVGISNDVPGDLERSHHRNGLNICIFALAWI